MSLPARAGLACTLLAIVFGASAESLAVMAVDMRALDGPAFPGQRQVTVRFLNDSGVPATQPQVVAAVPTGYVIVEGSVTGPGARVEFSSDGSSTFIDESEWPHGDGPRVTHVRWQLPGPMEPGVSGIVSFRVRPQTAPVQGQ